MPRKAKRIVVGLESLRPVAVLYAGDVHDLARLLLRLWDGMDRHANARSTKSGVRTRPTVGLLAMYYEMLVPAVSKERVLAELERHGLPREATVEDVGPKAASTAPAAGKGTGRRGRRKPAE
jgi:hypothetical protein